MKKTMMVAALAAYAALGAADPVSTALERKLLPGGNYIVYDNMLKAVYEADFAADEAWTACKTPAEFAARQRTVRAALMEALGGFPERCPLNVVSTGRVVRDGYTVEKIYFESQPHHHVTANLFLPDPVKFPGKRPGIVVPCGHSTNGKAASAYQRGSLQAAQAGMVALCYDPIDQGERVQCRKNPNLWSCGAHNNVGRRAELLGWNTARFRTWDGIRALDVLASRPEVDPSRLGVMGHSGGGTMSAWIMALDDRIACAAPSGFLSTVRTVCEQCGPQDAEQFVFGELAFGFNHLGHILLRAPSPALFCSSHGDFFPFSGVVETSRRARAVYAMLGKPDAFALSDTIGPHHWHESTRTRAVAWMNHCLQGGPAPAPMQTHRNLQFGFDYKNVDTGLAYEAKGLVHMRKTKWEASATPTGNTLDLPGERTVYDIMKDEADRAKAARPALTADVVRRVAGIRSADKIAFTVCEASEKDGVASAVLVQDDGTPVPVVTVGAGEPVLLVGDATKRADLAPHVKRLVAAGCRVTVADIRGFGETAAAKHVFYGIKSPDEELAQLGCLVGVPLVGRRAEDIIAAAKYMGGCPDRGSAQNRGGGPLRPQMGGGRPVRLIALGRAAIPAAHAFASARSLFSRIETINAPCAWAELFADDAKPTRFADVVHNAWRFYDWVDLLKH